MKKVEIKARGAKKSAVYSRYMSIFFATINAEIDLFSAESR